ncbi:hypothetical protein QQL37_11605 [Pantoea agglomerans]|uniref:hypothetical protein n=1 Tax=Enterobacter agglomerans TaxID=549 RepID=UPI003D80583E
MKRMLAVLTGMALLSACTVVDLDADGKPILPKDPHAKLLGRHLDIHSSRLRKRPGSRA